MESEEEVKYLICTHCPKIMVTKKKECVDKLPLDREKAYSVLSWSQITHNPCLLHSSMSMRPRAMAPVWPLCPFASAYLALNKWSVNIC